MDPRRWQQLIDRMTSLGHHSEAVERLRAHMEVHRRGMDGLEVELQQEMAMALGRAGAKVDAAVIEALLAREEALSASTPQARTEAVARYLALRRAAIRALEDLKIHREAVGLRRHRQLDQIYPMPPPWSDP